MTTDDPTDFPGWPEMSLPSAGGADRFEVDAIRIFREPARPPNAQDVIKFKKDNSASVAETALRFGLSRAQIIKVCGEA